MALKYGLNITESDWKRYLEQNERQQNGIRTWRQLFGNASLGYNAQSDALRTDYASAIAEAYKSNFARRNAILGAGLSAGSTQQLLGQSQADLHAAYDTYIRNYGSAASALAESYDKEVGTIDKALTERAANFANLYNSAYRYLSEELYGSTFTDINKNTSDYLTANNLGYALNGTAPKSWNELSRLLVDSDGNLTPQGVEFFDQMFNAEPQGYVRTDKDGNEISVRTFDQWLSDTNPTLRDWAVGADAFNYTRAGTNFGSAKVGAGLESDDMKYHQSEYLNEGDTKQMYDTGMLLLNPPIDIVGSSAYKSAKGAFEHFEDVRETYLNYTDPYNTGYNPHEVGFNKAAADYSVAESNLKNYVSTRIASVTDDVNTRLNSYQTVLETQLGEYYSDLLNSSEYSSALTAYQNAEKSFKDFEGNIMAEGIENFEKLQSDYRKAYENLMNVIYNFAKSKQYTGKISGF